jgi:predicted RND superfamily exporter protein
MPLHGRKHSLSAPWYAVGRDTVGAVLIVVAACALAPFAFHHRVDNRIEEWVGHDTKEDARYERFREQFGSDEIVVISYEGLPLFESKALQVQVDVLETLEAIPEVVSVAGIPAIYRDIFGLDDRDELEAELTNTPFYRNFVISGDGAVAGLVLETNPPDDIDGRRRLVQEIESAVSPLRDAGWAVDVVGPPVLNVTLDTTSRREAARLLPVALIVSAAVLVLFLRSIRAVAVALACAGVTLAVTVGTMAALNRPMNMVTTSMPALVWVLSLAGLIHLLHAYLASNGNDLPAKIAAAVARTRRPCAISSITTAVGFFSLAAAPMRAVRDFGIFAGFGLLVSFVATYTLGPVLIRLLRIPGHSHSMNVMLRAASDRAGKVATSSPRRIIVIVAALVAVAAIYLPNLHTETNPLNYLPENSTIARAYKTVPEKLTGLYTLEVIVDTHGSWLDPVTLTKLDALARQMESMPEIARVLSPVSYLRKLNQWDNDFDPDAYVLPESAAAGRRLLDEAENPDQIARFATADESAVRLAALARVMDSSNFRRLCERVESLPEYRQLNAEMTGIIRQIVGAQDALVTAQLRSLAIAFLLIFPCIYIGIRSWSLTILALALDAIPVLAAFALMGFANIPLDAATVMVAGITIGVAVDDTVHIMCAYQAAATGNTGVASALRSALAQVGPSITATTMTSLAGFFVLLRSDFVPLQRFGLIAGTAMIVAWAADVFLLPALLLLTAGSDQPTEPLTSQRDADGRRAHAAKVV